MTFDETENSLRGMYKYSLFGLFLLSFTGLKAQYHPQLRSGRPGMMMGVNTVGRGVWQIQSGVLLHDKIDRHFLREQTALRWGCFEFFELSAVISSQHNWRTFLDSSGIDGRMEPFQFGFRAKLINGKGKLQLHSAVQFRTNVWPASGQKLTYSANTRIFRGLKSGMNIGWQRRGDEQQLFYVFQASPKIKGDWKFLFELFGNSGNIFNEGASWRLGLNAGGAYYLNPNLMLDFSFGKLPNQTLKEADPFLNLGFSWRVGRNKLHSAT